jgi:hypothetical protein
LSYNVKYEDIGLKDFKDTWDYQEKIFQKLVDSKKSAGANTPGSGKPVHGTLIFVEHPHAVQKITFFSILFSFRQKMRLFTGLTGGVI